MKIALLMKFMGMKPMLPSFFHSVQSLYVIPSIQKFFDGMLQKTHDKHRDTDLVLSGGFL